MKDTEIVDLYWERNEVAIQQTQQKYGAYLSKVAYNISGADIVFFTVIDRAVLIQYGRRTKERLRSAVRAFDIGSFHKTSFGRM